MATAADLQDRRENPVDLNTGSREELAKVSGIGAVRAQNIIDYRNQHGPFRSVEELADVPGFRNLLDDEIRAGVIVGEREQRGETGKMRGGERG